MASDLGAEHPQAIFLLPTSEELSQISNWKIEEFLPESLHYRIRLASSLPSPIRNLLDIKCLAGIATGSKFHPLLMVGLPTEEAWDEFKFEFNLINSEPKSE